MVITVPSLWSVQAPSDLTPSKSLRAARPGKNCFLATPFFSRFAFAFLSYKNTFLPLIRQHFVAQRTVSKIFAVDPPATLPPRNFTFRKNYCLTGKCNNFWTPKIELRMFLTLVITLPKRKMKTDKNGSQYTMLSPTSAYRWLRFSLRFFYKTSSFPFRFSRTVVMLLFCSFYVTAKDNNKKRREEKDGHRSSLLSRIL